MGEHARLDLVQESGAGAGGQAATGVPAARPMPPAADPVGGHKGPWTCAAPGCLRHVKREGGFCGPHAMQRAKAGGRRGESPGQVPQCPDCNHPVSRPGIRCRKCAGLARRGKPRGRPTSAPGGRFKCESGCGETVARKGDYCPGCQALAGGQARPGGRGRCGDRAVEPAPHRAAEKGRIERAAKRPKAGAARRPAAAAAVNDSPTGLISDRLGETVRRIAADLADEVADSVAREPWIYALARDAMAADPKVGAEVARYRAMESLLLLAAAECSD